MNRTILSTYFILGTALAAQEQPSATSVTPAPTPAKPAASAGAKVIPLTPLTPAKPVDPAVLEKIIASAEIIPLTPAKPVAPATPTAPAEAKVIPATPLTPAKPATPAVPEPVKADVPAEPTAPAPAPAKADVPAEPTAPAPTSAKADVPAEPAAPAPAPAKADVPTKPAPPAPAPVKADVPAKPALSIAPPQLPTPQEQQVAEKAQPIADAVRQGQVPASVSKPQPEAKKPAPARKDTLNLPKNYRGIVRVEASKKRNNYATPWQTGTYGGGTGTAFLVGPGLFMTNAHVIADAETLYISQYADARKIPAKVKYVAHDADLALLEISGEDCEHFRNVQQLKFSDELPRLEDTVRAIGYPIGGSRLSVTRGIVSRIENSVYSHARNSAHLAVQIDAAINPGNSGGPVFLGDKVVGVAFQGLLQANSTGYIIPAPVIKRFFKDIEDGSYDQYVALGADFFQPQNPGMRRHYGLADDGLGVVVGRVVQGGSTDGVLELGDVVTAINGKPVDSSGMIELEGERLSLEELAERSFMGDSITFDIIRKGEKMQKTAKLIALPNKKLSAPSFNEQPRYVSYGGFIFQPITLNEIEAHRVPLTNIITTVNDFLYKSKENPREDLVMLTRVLPDEVNSRLSSYGNRVVKSVNGVEVKGLAHLYELLYPADESKAGEFTVIEMEEGNYPLVFDRKSINDANKRIWASYGIAQPARLDAQPK